MALTLSLCGVTVALMIFSVFRVPTIRFGRFQIGGYCFFALLGALALLLSGAVSPDAVGRGITADSEVNPIKILILFLSMTTFSIFLDELGFFRYLASATLSHAGRSQYRLFFYLYATVSVLTVFTSNDIIILTFTPFVCSFAKNAGIRPLPYLFGEFIAANTWSMALMIGNPTNIYIASFVGLDFFSYVGTMILPTLAAGGVSLLLLFFVFRKDLSVPISPCTPEPCPIAERPLLLIGLIHLSVCIVLLTVSSYIGFSMWLVSLCLMASLFICVLLYRSLHRQKPVILLKTVRRMPWELVPFMLSMFVLVISLDESGVLAEISDLLGTSEPIWIFGGGSFLVANLINNIPMSVLFANLADRASSIPAAYAAIAGSNLGACLTPVGALAGIMWADILRRRGIPFDYRDFVRYGAIIAIPAMAAALGVLSLVL